MLLSPLVGVADTSPEGGSKEYVILSAREISHRTIALIVVIARHEVPRQSFGVKYGVYAAYFFGGIATLTAIRHLTLTR